MIERTVQLTGADRSGDGERFDYAGTGLYFHRVDGGPIWLRVGDDRMLIPVVVGRFVELPFRSFWLVHAAGLVGEVVVLVCRAGELIADMGRSLAPIVRTVVGTAPAAGEQLIETVPTGKVWRPLSISVRFSTDATVSNRNVRLGFRDGANWFYMAPGEYLQTASNTIRYNFGGHGLSVVGLGSEPGVLIAFPPAIVLNAGFRFQSVVMSSVGGDQWEAPVLSVEEWSL